MLSGNIIQDRRDDPVDARKGIYNTADFGLAWRYFGSQRSFGRLLGRNATYHALTRRLTLARETSLGALLPFRIASEQEGADPAQAIPFPERLFGGGGTSHRGFNENQAGPRDLRTGFPLGGNSLLFNKTELRFPLLGENIGGVLFHDAGNVYSRFSDITFRQSQRDLEDFNYMVHAVGFGIRYRTPIGPIRFDLAYSINPPAFTGCKGSYEEMLECSGPNPPATNAPSRQQISHLQFFFSIGQTF
jgi:outer membrane protein assembly factor BamA